MSRPHGATELADRRAGPAGRPHRRHDPLLRPRRACSTPPVKQGRNRLYGPEHLERLDRIRELQAPALLARRDPGHRRRRPPRPRRPLHRRRAASYTLAELIERSGVDDQLVAGPARRRPAPRSRPSSAARPTTTPTSALLRAVAELRSIGMTAEILLALGRIYVDHFGALQRDVLDMLSGQRQPGVGRRRARRDPAQLTANAQRLMPAINQLLNYVHQRTLQRLTLEAARSADRAARAASAALVSRRGPRCARRCRRRSAPARLRRRCPSSPRSCCASTASRCRGADSRSTTSCCRRPTRLRSSTPVWSMMNDAALLRYQ